MIVATLAIIIIAGVTIVALTDRKSEHFMDYVGGNVDAVAGVRPEVELAEMTQGLPLSDFLSVKSGLNRATAAECAAADGARVTEPGGSYLQRTNNFRHKYPDYCMTRPDDFVASVYAPGMAALGSGVGCAGQC